MARMMLDKWAEHRNSIEAIELAIGLLESKGIISWESPRKPHEVICELYDIDLTQLDSERDGNLACWQALLTERGLK